MLVSQRSAWMQPTANSMVRAAFTMSAPTAIFLIMSKPETVLPLAIKVT